MYGYLAVSFGIILAQIVYVPKLVGAALLLGGLISLCLIVCSKILCHLNYPLRLGYFCISLLLLGYAYASLTINRRLAEQLNYPLPHCQVSGYLISPPRMLGDTRQVEFKVSGGSLAGRIFQLTYPTTIVLNPGDNYTLELNLQPLHIPINFAAIDYQRYLVAKNINARGWVVRIIQNNGPSLNWEAWLNHWRSSMIDYILSQTANLAYAPLTIALVTGYQQLISQQQWQTFRRSGLMHIIAISGLHITLVAGVVGVLANRLLRIMPIFGRCPRQIYALWIGISAALTYSLLAGFAVTTQRSFYLLVILGLLSSQRRYIPLMHKLAISLAWVLVVDPFACISSGFWFSFGIVATIYALAQRSHAAKWIAWLKLQLAIALVSFPLSIFLFKVYPPIGLIANLWAIPVLGNLVTPLVLLCSIFHLGSCLHLVTGWLSLVMRPIEILARLPSYSQNAPNLCLLILSYLGILMLFFPKSGCAKNASGLMLLLALFMVQPAKQLSYGTTRISVFANPKAGISLIQTHSHTILVLVLDGVVPVLKQEQQLATSLLPYLLSQQIKQLDYIISNQAVERKLLEWFRQNQIQVAEKLAPSSTWHIDGVTISEFRNQQQLALELGDRDGLSYLGTGFYLPRAPAGQNIIILLPLANLEWVYQHPPHNLILNYPQQAKLSMEQLSANLNLSRAQIFNLPEAGSIQIENNQISTDSRTMAE